MHIVIIGNGIAGVSAAVRIRQLQPEWKITMISGESWIKERRPIDYVLRNLKEANFDPEFFRKYETEIAGTFREQLA
jgi:NADPH-dependent 2,4-dienoyl-CoA reductase/sulfur reductase-like enzyme